MGHENDTRRWHTAPRPAETTPRPAAEGPRTSQRELVQASLVARPSSAKRRGKR